MGLCVKLVLAAAIAATLVMQRSEALKDQPLTVKFPSCTQKSVQPGVSDWHPLTSCMKLTIAYYRLLRRDWHQFWVTCVTNKGTAEPSIYENWATKAADCIDNWANIQPGK